MSTNHQRKIQFVEEERNGADRDKGKPQSSRFFYLAKLFLYLNVDVSITFI